MDGLEVYVVLCLVITLFNQSKNNAVLEPRTGHFRKLVGLEGKTKHLSCEAKAKAFKMYPRGRSRDHKISPRGLTSDI